VAAPAARLLVVVGLRHEARALARAPAARPGWPAVGIRIIGPGAASLARLRDEVDGLRPDALLVTGLAGGCAPGLRTGHLVLGDVVGPTAGGAWLAPDAGLRHRAVRTLAGAGLPYRTGRLLTAPTVVATAAAKRACWERDLALAVDMESAHVAAWAAREGIPAVTVRAVADGPEEGVPPGLAAVLGADGRVRPAALAAWAVQPPLLGAALRLWRRSRLALRSLERFLVAFTRTPVEP
jgi:hypothetical protein